MKNYFLEDEIIGLRNLEILDCAGNYVKWFNDKDVCKYNDHFRYPTTKESLESFVSKSSKDKSSIVLAVEIKKDEVHIGNISLQRIDFINRSAEIAFIFGEKSYWGNGYATRSARMVINHGFNELGMNRIYFGTSEDNIGMQKVGEKLGFCKGGVRRQAIYKDGAFHDIYDYDLLNTDWNGN